MRQRVRGTPELPPPDPVVMPPVVAEPAPLAVPLPASPEELAQEVAAESSGITAPDVAQTPATPEQLARDLAEESQGIGGPPDAPPQGLVPWAVAKAKEMAGANVPDTPEEAAAKNAALASVGLPPAGQAPTVAPASIERGHVAPSEGPGSPGQEPEFNPTAPAPSGTRLPTIVVPKKIPTKSVTDQESVQIGAASPEMVEQYDESAQRGADAKDVLAEINADREQQAADIMTGEGGVFDLKAEQDRERAEKERAIAAEVEQKAHTVENISKQIRQLPEAQRKHFFASKNFGQGVLKAIGLGLLMLGGDAKFSKSLIDEVVNKDVNDQMRRREHLGQDLENARTVYDVMMRSIGDKRAALAASQAAAIDEVLVKIDKLMNGITDEEKRAKLDSLKEEYQQEQLRLRGDYRSLYGDKIARAQSVAQAVPQRTPVPTPTQKLTAERAIKKANNEQEEQAQIEGQQAEEQRMDRARGIAYGEDVPDAETSEGPSRAVREVVQPKVADMYRLPPEEQQAVMARVRELQQSAPDLSAVQRVTQALSEHQQAKFDEEDRLAAEAEKTKQKPAGKARGGATAGGSKASAAEPPPRTGITQSDLERRPGETMADHYERVQALDPKLAVYLQKKVEQYKKAGDPDRRAFMLALNDLTGSKWYRTEGTTTGETSDASRIVHFEGKQYYATDKANAIKVRDTEKAIAFGQKGLADVRKFAGRADRSVNAEARAAATGMLNSMNGIIEANTPGGVLSKEEIEYRTNILPKPDKFADVTEYNNALTNWWGDTVDFIKKRLKRELYLDVDLQQPAFKGEAAADSYHRTE